MSPDKIIRAWKDEEFRRKLGSRQRSLLPENPAGIIELSDDELTLANGGTEDEAAIGTTVTIPITVTVTAALSCWPACGATVWKGTCAVASYGCCGGPAHEEALF